MSSPVVPPGASSLRHPVMGPDEPARQKDFSMSRFPARFPAQWCRLNRHQPLPAQHQTLSQKLRGHFAYFGITGNSCALSRFRGAVVHIWKKWLARRRRRGFLSWTVFDRLLRRYPLPPAVAIHSACRRVGQAVT